MKMRLCSLILGFICGSVPSGMIIARTKGVDLRHSGSGNIGSTNVLRSMGRGYGALTLIMDMLKAVIPIILTQYIFGRADMDMRYLILLYTGFGAVLGHDFSPWLKFRGGKGVATSGGMILMTDPIIFVVDFITIFATAAVTGYVSLGSMLAGVFYLVFNVITVLTGRVPGWRFYPLYYRSGSGPEIIIITLMFVALAVWRHKDNIIRLMDGRENKIKL